MQQQLESLSFYQLYAKQMKAMNLKPKKPSLHGLRIMKALSKKVDQDQRKTMRGYQEDNISD